MNQQRQKGDKFWVTPPDNFRTNDPHHWIQPGKMYKAEHTGNNSFIVTNETLTEDMDRHPLCLYRGCAHIKGGTWIVYDKPFICPPSDTWELPKCP